jgi:type VI secretion system protein ImpI
VLTLRIDNFDKLPNGSPLEYTVDRRGFDFGRDQHLDWTLPDKSRVVSGKHCEIRFYEGAYWLIDTSTNGTFLNDSAKRMQSPYRLNDGDKLAVGDYVLFVRLNLADAKSPEHVPAPFIEPIENLGRPSSTPDARVIDNIWETQGRVPPPIDARDLMPRQLKNDRVPDFLSQAAVIPRAFEPDPVRKPNPPSSTKQAEEDDLGVWHGGQSDDVKYFSHNQTKHQQSIPDTRKGEVAIDTANGVRSMPETPGVLEGNEAVDEFIKRFANGAGISVDALAPQTVGDLAEQTGQLLNIICLQLMSMLHARAEAKALSRSGNRTLIQSADNNPLKFMPTPEEALRTMLSPNSKGYLDAKKAIESAFADLKLHQIASLAAMQAAVTQLFDDLSPEAIFKSVEGKKSLLGSGKSKQWDIYAERWAAKVGHREHGMLGAFLDLFAEQYDKLSKHK